ncbi:MAG: hypothetical protein ACK58P_03095, partial [Betaproteobacteria bacterium]
GQVLALEQVVGALSHGRLMLQNITHALSPTHTDVASAMTEIFTGSEGKDPGLRIPDSGQRAAPAAAPAVIPPAAGARGRSGS